jgi:hypothetical protein
MFDQCGDVAMSRVLRALGDTGVFGSRQLSSKPSSKTMITSRCRSSSYDLVSHATVHSRADELFGVKVIWESGIDLARLVECLYLFRRERQVEARKIILQLRKLARPYDGDDRHRTVAKPCQRDLRHAAAGLIGYGFDGRYDSAGPLLVRHEILHRVPVHAAPLGGESARGGAYLARFMGRARQASSQPIIPSRM